MTADLFQRVVSVTAQLPGIEVSTSYGTPALKMKKKLLARMWEDGETLVVPTESVDEKEFLIATEPDVYFQTPHYFRYPYVLVRLAVVTDERLRGMLEAAWRRAAPAKVLREHDAAHETRAPQL